MGNILYFLRFHFGANSNFSKKILFEKSWCWDSALLLHREVFLDKTPRQASQHTSYSTLGPVVEPRDPFYPHRSGIPSRCFLRNFSKNRIFEKLVRKNSFRDCRAWTVFFVVYHSVPSMDPGGQEQPDTLQNFPAPRNFPIFEKVCYFWEIHLTPTTIRLNKTVSHHRDQFLQTL